MGMLLCGALLYALLKGSALACDEVAYVLQSCTPCAQVAKVYRLLLQAMLPEL